MCGNKGSTKGIALGGDPKGNGSGGRMVDKVVSTLCPKNQNSSGTGPTGDVYTDGGFITNDRGSWVSQQAWYQEFKSDGVKGWFRWVFLSIEKHQPDCKWRRFRELFSDGLDPI